MKKIIKIGKEIFKNAHDIKKTYEGIYFRDYKILSEKECYEFKSFLINLDEEILKNIDINSNEIEINDKNYKILTLKKWTQEIPCPIKRKRIKVTKEVAQERIDNLVGKNKFELIEWNTTLKPAVIKCLKCGHEITFSQGQAVYTYNPGYGGFKGVCTKCIKK